MYSNIVIGMALDQGFGKNALEVAHRLLADGGKITALHVYDAPQGSVSAYLDEEVVRTAYEAARKKLTDRVKDLPKVTAMILKGHSGRTITDYAAEIGADCIVIGSHRPDLRDFLLGSTAARVVRHAPCAVHVLRNKA